MDKKPKKQSKMKDDPAWKLTQELGIGMMEARARLAAVPQMEVLLRDDNARQVPAPTPAPEPSPSLVDSEPVAEIPEPLQVDPENFM